MAKAFTNLGEEREDVTYKQALTEAMQELARDPATCFVGYGIRYSRAMGTLAGIPESQLIETPVAENLMVGLATGLALMGRRPVVFVERCDFILNAADAIVNHLDMIETMSRGEFKPAVILRVVVGNRMKPLFTGETHTRDHSEAFRHMLAMEVATPVTPSEVARRYQWAYEAMLNGQSTMIVEKKDLL